MEPGPELDALRSRYRLDAPFVLNVGRLEPRKNLERLIRAFDTVRRRVDARLQLVLVGHDDFRSDTVRRAAEALPDSAVRFLGPVPDDVLPGLYNLASVLAYPSLVEGFGMPVLEAMACGTPVLSSPRGALPEVGGDCVVWAEPEDPDAIASGIERLLTDSDERFRLRRAGLERSSGFRWEETARRTLEAYRKCID
jgi:glycosyltransferase involved in cell wall biosynthesis